MIRGKRVNKCGWKVKMDKLEKGKYVNILVMDCEIFRDINGYSWFIEWGRKERIKLKWVENCNGEEEGFVYGNKYYYIRGFGDKKYYGVGYAGFDKETGIYLRYNKIHICHQEHGFVVLEE